MYIGFTSGTKEQRKHTHHQQATKLYPVIDNLDYL